jgi:hypothetical protein
MSGHFVVVNDGNRGVGYEIRHDVDPYSSIAATVHQSTTLFQSRARRSQYILSTTSLLLPPIFPIVDCPQVTFGLFFGWKACQLPVVPVAKYTPLVAHLSDIVHEEENGKPQPHYYKY